MLKIAYSGSLDAHFPKGKPSVFSRIVGLFWTYKHNTVDSSTRSAYYLIKAIVILKEKHRVSPDDLQIELWGSIHEGNRKQAIQAGVDGYFNFGGYMPKPDSLKKLNSSDVLFLPLEKSNTPGVGTLFIPGKLFEYLNAGKPILALCEQSDCKDILEASGLGICVEPDKPDLIADVLLKLINDKELSKTYKANDSYIKQYAFRNKAEELAIVFDRLSVK